ncbi:UNVERIFIED_CONTAM: hypothetical protein GTU68_029133 [Idotea baltica]|nr:hypothetical protein [Idotea baltica]
MVSRVSVKAHEGMWIPSLIKMFLTDMQADGLQLSAEDIYAVNKSSLKDAIVHFGGGCTSEIVSDKGLILTNHHCGFGQIQSHSSLEHDYLKDGFWAMSHEEELTNPGLTATIIDRIEDVTRKVLMDIDENTPPSKRAALVAERIATIKSQVESVEKGKSAQIKAFYYGNQYFMIVTKTFKDVRLVGAPPSSVGKYGGDTDNWMWPRHTGDFSVFRIYSGTDNQPADIAEENVPYKPAHHFPVNITGTKAGDFTMIYGFPGRTQQYLHSSSVDFITQDMNPKAIDMRNSSLEIIDAAMASSDQIRIQYASKQARIANSWKKWIGENRGLDRLNAIQVKQDLEASFHDKVMASAELKPIYGNVLKDLEASNKEGEGLMMARSMLIEFFYVGPEFMRHASFFENLVENYDALVEKKNGAEGFFKNYNASVDQKILTVLYPKYIENLAPQYRPKGHAALVAKYGSNWKKYAADIFEDSYFVDKSRELNLLNKFKSSSVKKIKADPGYKLMKSVLGAWRKAQGAYVGWQGKNSELMRVYVKGMMTAFPNEKYWPDANSTLRLAWGKVEGSEPRDGVTYQPFTTLDGVLAKYVPGDREFDLPAKLIELAKNRDYGRYGFKGELPVCFTASNHTTGGNSGSPVLNGEGHLIGINFDRSWESTMSDIMYDPERCRNIVVDIRYVLFMIDKYAGASHLVDEMSIVDRK